MELRLVRPHVNRNNQLFEVIKMVCGFHQATNGTNIIGTSRKAGIISRSDMERRELVWFVNQQNVPNVQDSSQSKKRVDFDLFKSGV
jgi:hypothetical protein